MTTETTQKNFVPNKLESRWSNRFIFAAIIQGLIMTVATVLLVDPLSYFNVTSGPLYYFSPARVIAGGGGGTWMFTGYILYLVIGVVAVGLTALFYYHFEVTMNKPYKGISKVFAWLHLVLMNVGAAGSMLLMMWGGYIAGFWAATLPGTTVNGQAITAANVDYYIHVHDLANLEDPIGALALIACIGALCGGIGYLLNYFYTRR